MLFGRAAAYRLIVAALIGGTTLALAPRASTGPGKFDASDVDISHFEDEGLYNLSFSIRDPSLAKATDALADCQHTDGRSNEREWKDCFSAADTSYSFLIPTQDELRNRRFTLQMKQQKNSQELTVKEQLVPEDFGKPQTGVVVVAGQQLPRFYDFPELGKGLVVKDGVKTYNLEPEDFDEPKEIVIFVDEGKEMRRSRIRYRMLEKKP